MKNSLLAGSASSVEIKKFADANAMNIKNIRCDRSGIALQSKCIALARTTKKMIARLANLKKCSTFPLLESQIKQKKRYAPNNNACLLWIDCSIYFCEMKSSKTNVLKMTKLRSLNGERKSSANLSVKRKVRADWMLIIFSGKSNP